MTSTPWMEIVVNTVLFLELSDEETVELDAAVKQLELISALLQSLSTNEKVAFLNYVEQLACQEEQAGGRAEVIAFLRSMDENFGLT